MSVYSEKLTSADGSEIPKVNGVELPFSVWAKAATLAVHFNLNWFKFSGRSGRRVFKVIEHLSFQPRRKFCWTDLA